MDGDDWGWWKATLYRTPLSNRYFLAGEGGPMSRYSGVIGPVEWNGGHRIDPLTGEQAYNWARIYLSPNIVEQYFAEFCHYEDNPGL